MSAVGVSLLELALCGLLPNCDLASPVAHMERREGKEKVLLESWFLFFGGGFFFLDQTGLQLKRSTCLCLSSALIKGVCHHLVASSC